MIAAHARTGSRKGYIPSTLFFPKSPHLHRTARLSRSGRDGAGRLRWRHNAYGVPRATSESLAGAHKQVSQLTI